MLDSKYQFMEVNTQRRATGLREKIPDIQKTLETVRFLQTQKVGRYAEISLEMGELTVGI